MNRKFFALSVLCSGLVLPTHAQLVFSNITAAAGSAGVNLNAVALGGANTNVLVAVGTNSRVFTATFDTADLSTATAWFPTNVSTTTNLHLKGVVYGNGLFAAGGSNNVVFRSSDGGRNWANAGKVFTNNAIELQGLAFDGATFVATPGSSQNTWSTNSLLAPWTVGTNSPSYIYEFLESFRGVTAFGLNKFASVGIQGIIRVSTNGGRLWNGIVGITNTFARPDLLGVASDGANTLVAVGTNGVILVSTNGGFAWATNSSVISTATTRLLNGVAYLNPGFIAVGRDGTNAFIVTSTNGVNWDIVASSTVTSNLPLTSPLRGVTFATTGPLANVALLVGDAGTVLIGGLTPFAPVAGTNAYVCASGPGFVNSGTVSVTVSNWVTVDWFTNASGGTPVFTGSPTFTPNNLAPGTTNTFYAQSRDKRTGFLNTNRTAAVVIVNPLLFVHVTNPLPVICSGDAVVLDGSASGGTPGGGGSYTYSWAPTNYLNNPALAKPTFTPPADLTNGVSYPLTLTVTDFSLVPGHCSVSSNVVITVHPRLTATVSGTTTICNGSSTPILAALTGTGPWNVTWSSNGVVVVVHTGVTNNPDVLTQSPVNPNPNSAITATYTVTALNDVHCTAIASDLRSNAVVTVNPRPTATLNDAISICNGQGTTMKALLTGISPWTVQWSDGLVQTTNAAPGNSVVLLRGFTAAQVTNVFPNAATNYFFTITSVTNATTCAANQPGDLVGTNVITVNPRPTSTVSGDSTICNGSSTPVLAALTGLGPWNVTWSSNGVVVAIHTGVATNVDILTVSPVNTNLYATYTASFTVTALTDAHCTADPGDLPLAAPATITVNPRPTATTAVSGAAIICNGDPTEVKVVLTGNGPWNYSWRSNGIVIQSLTGVTTQTNTLAVTPTTTNLNTAAIVTYSVSELSDTNCTALNADLTNNSAITVNPRPKATLTSGNQTNYCNGGTVTLNALLNGVSPWTIRWSDNYEQTTNASPGNAATLRRVLTSLELTNLSATLATNYEFYILSVSNQGTTCVAQNPGDILGTNVVTVVPYLGVTASAAPGTVVNNQILQLTATVTGGTPPYSFSWSQTGGAPLTNSTSQNTAATIPNNGHPDDVYRFTVVVTDGSPPQCRATNSISVTNGTVLPPADVTTCLLVRHPILVLSVEAPKNDVVDWYNENFSVLLAQNTTNYTPTNQIPGTYVFKIVDDPPGSSGPTTTNQVSVTFQSCPSNLNVTALSPGAVVVDWYGNRALYSATNLVTPNWAFVTAGVGGITNRFTNSVVSPPAPPERFFRFNLFTNAP